MDTLCFWIGSALICSALLCVALPFYFVVYIAFYGCWIPDPLVVYASWWCW
jgi:hypothetical protein